MFFHTIQQDTKTKGLPWPYQTAEFPKKNPPPQTHTHRLTYCFTWPFCTAGQVAHCWFNELILVEIIFLFCQNLFNQNRYKKLYQSVFIVENKFELKCSVEKSCQSVHCLDLFVKMYFKGFVGTYVIYKYNSEINLKLLFWNLCTSLRNKQFKCLNDEVTAFEFKRVYTFLVDNFHTL